MFKIDKNGCGQATACKDTPRPAADAAEVVAFAHMLRQKKAGLREFGKLQQQAAEDAREHTFVPTNGRKDGGESTFTPTPSASAPTDGMDPTISQALMEHAMQALTMKEEDDDEEDEEDHDDTSLFTGSPFA
jgi:hypothetical protein